MDIQELIKAGTEVVSKSRQNSQYVGEYYYGKDYENWLSLATRFVEMNFPNDTDSMRFRQLAEKANGESISFFNKLISILYAFEKLQPIPNKPDVFSMIEQIIINFNRFDTNIRRRHGNRSSISINDEYDLQDAFYAILKLFINDIRPEDYVPSYAGSNSRVDYLLPEYGIIIELKMTNQHLHDKEIGEQLIIDFDRYKQLNKCKHLICFTIKRVLFQILMVL